MSSYSFSSTSFSSSQTHNGRTTNRSYTEEQHSDPAGTAVRTTHQDGRGAPAVQEVRYFDAGGREIPAERAARRGLGPAAGAPGDSSSGRRIEDVSDRDQRQDDVDELYRERMEDEYAKREGGA